MLNKAYEIERTRKAAKMAAEERNMAKHEYAFYPAARRRRVLLPPTT